MSGSIILQPFANAGDIFIPPQTDPSNFVNFNQGYTPDYEIELASGNPQAKAVERTVQNALFKIATENIQAWQQLGFAQWYSTMPGGYAENAMVMRQDAFLVWKPYRSTVSGNITDPNGSATWEYIPLPSAALQNVPMPSGGPGGAAAMLVTVATNFNSFTTGTWTVKTDAIANGSANAPAPQGGTPAAGVLESIVWLNGATPYTAQRYLDRNGNSFFRGASAGVWTPWTSTSPPVTYSLDTSIVDNLVSATFPLSSAILPDNSLFWVKIATTNTGATTFTPNPAIIVTPKPVLGQADFALQGGELVDAGHALFVYRLATDDFALVFCSGGATQVGTAINSRAPVPLSQVNSLIAAATSGIATDQSIYYMGQF